MRILHVMPHYYPAVRYGGPIRSVQGLAAATAALGHDVQVYTTNVDGKGLSDVSTGQETDLEGVKVWYFPVGAGRRIFRSPELGRALDANLAAFDVVHIHYMWVWTTIRAAAAARRRGVPYVLAPRGMLVSDLIRRRSKLAKRTWLALVGARDIAGASAVHVTSEREASDFAQLGLSSRRVVILPNGVDEPDEVANSPSAESDGRPYILFLGRISWKKGLDRLIRALPFVKAADIVVAGYDENGYQSVVERLAVELDVRSRIHFIGPVEGHRKQNLLQKASCLVLPSYNENFGMTVIEAMACGVPVVVTPEVGLADVVASTGSGLVVDGDPVKLAGALNYMICNRQEARAMGAVGRRITQERYSWDAIARSAEALYGECCAAPPAATSRGSRGRAASP